MAGVGVLFVLKHKSKIRGKEHYRNRILEARRQVNQYFMVQPAEEKLNCKLAILK